MQDGGLGSADFAKYLAQLASGHGVSVGVELLDSSGNVLVSFDQDSGGGRPVTTEDGQVDMTADGRVLTLSVVDEDRLLGVYEGLNWIGRMLRVTYYVYVLELDQTVAIRVFTGPVVPPTVRQGEKVTFTAHGKERFCKHGLRSPVTYKARHKKTEIIKIILMDLCGEDAANLGGVPDLPAKLPRDLHIDVEDTPFDVVVQLSRQLGRYFSYDGHGQVQMALRDAKNPVYTFTGAKTDPGVVGAVPEIGTDWSNIKNAVHAVGGQLRDMPAPKVDVIVGDDSPFAPKKLGRNGSEAVYWDDLTLEHIHDGRALKAAALDRLRVDTTAIRDMKLETLPIPVFDFGDFCRVEAPPDYVGDFYLDAFTLPLKLDGPSKTMSIGWNDSVSAAAAARRSRPGV